jgi:signal transduction histidine kinase
MFPYDLEVTTAAHDLRNRLSIAGCEIYQLRRKLAGAARATEPGVSDCLETIESSLRQTNTLLEHLLELARNQASVLVSSDPRTLDLVALTKRVVGLERRSGDRPQVTVKTMVKQLPGAWDETRMAHLLHNLVSNALQYSNAGQEVVVTLDQVDDTAVLRVADQGMGIPAADLPRIFEPFFRARNAELTAPGLGLGLASARLIVEQYGGTIDVESTEHRGTVFTVRLPLNHCGPPMPLPALDCVDPDDQERAQDARERSLG